MSESALDKHIVVKIPDHFLPDAFIGESVGKGKEDGATVDNMDPSRPFLVIKKSDLDKADEWVKIKYAWMAKSLTNDIIIPDPTPQVVRDAFFDISPRLDSVLRKDSVRCFFRLFAECTAAMAFKCNITSETLSCIVRHNALRCAKTVLEGKAPQLSCMHANPNCINPYGIFPLHEAAERFSVDMIKLLFCHGASANLHTVNDAGIPGLLPLHVAVGNTCLHKYLEDNLSPVQYHEDYIYKLIHLLCLPEMKVFLDTVRLLAEKTDNLADELWNYMKNDKLVESAVLLLAARKHIREGKPDGFDIIAQRIYEDYDSLVCDKGDTAEGQKLLEERRALLKCKCLIVTIISQAGEVLDNYIQAHSEVPNVEVLARVSYILKEFGFCPNEEYIDTMILCPYNKISYSDIVHKDVTKAVAQMSTSLPAAEKKAARKKALKGWDPTFIKRNFFPYWRSVLGAQLSVSNGAADEKSMLHRPQFRNSVVSNESSSLNHNISFLGRIQQLSGTHESRRYSTAAFRMLTKVLKT